MPDQRPQVIIIAGPNGAGKSSTAPMLLGHQLKIISFVNADAIARGLSAFNPEGAAYTAGRIMLERIRTLAAKRSSFGFETTLAARSYAHSIDEWTAAGYEVNLLYLWLHSADLACDRVANRVRSGGHSIDPQTIRDRWAASIRNLVHLYIGRCHRWTVYDNSQSGEPRPIAQGGLSQPMHIDHADTWNMILRTAGPQP
jgi:predicted ABC-type ATPase